MSNHDLPILALCLVLVVLTGLRDRLRLSPTTAMLTLCAAILAAGALA